jgi:hypothetical protein
MLQMTNHLSRFTKVADGAKKGTAIPTQTKGDVK